MFLLEVAGVRGEVCLPLRDMAKDSVFSEERREGRQSAPGAKMPAWQETCELNLPHIELHGIVERHCIQTMPVFLFV